jgi:hypothetical protein
MLKKNAKSRKVNRVIKITLLLLFVTWIGSIGVLAGLLMNHVAHLEKMVANPSQSTLTSVASEIHGVRQDVIILRGALAPLLWIGTCLGGDLGAAEPLAEAGVNSIIAADETLSALAPSLGDLTLSSLSMKQLPQILDVLVNASPALISADSHLDAAATELAHIDGRQSPRVEYWVSKATQYVKLAQFGIGGAQIAPGLLGNDGSRTYLVLIQNSDELRPTGGFISAVGRIELNHGQIISLTVQDSYAVDDFSKYYPYPPQELQKYMGSEQWVFRDANWSPDFPTTARDAISLYQIAHPEQVDGVIGIDLLGIQMLISGVEPLHVQGLPEPLTAANVSKILRESWNPSQDISGSDDWRAWYSTRKQFIGSVMRVAMEKFTSGEINWKQLGFGIMDALNQRQLLIFTSSESEMLGKLLWDGALRSADGDYLMVVDTNMGFNKTDVLVSRELKYRITLQPDGRGQAVAEINYIHRGMKKDIVCTQKTPYDAKINYESIINRCYFDFLRLLVPNGSQFRDATAHPVSGEYLISGVSTDGKAELLVDDHTRRSTIAQFFVVEYGRQLLTHFEYDLPVVVTTSGDQKRYTLLIQKQSGIGSMPVKVMLFLPARARIISSSPSPTNQSDTEVEFILSLDTDQIIDVIYALAP